MEGEAIRLLLELDEAGFAVSSGSACSSSHAGEPSHVLEAMGYDAFRARGSLRITLGRFNTLQEMERFVDVLPRAVQSLSPITSRVLSDINLTFFPRSISVMAETFNIQLPGLNCGLCGYRTCEEFQDLLVSSPEVIQRCIHLSKSRIDSTSSLPKSRIAGRSAASDNNWLLREYRGTKL